MRAVGDDDKTIEFQAIARIDTPEELVAFRHGGILPYVLRQLVGQAIAVTQRVMATPGVADGSSSRCTDVSARS